MIMNKYELTYLISPKLGNEEIRKIQEEIESFVTEKKGEILNRKIDPAKRKLGYEVSGESEAYLASLVFTAYSPEINSLENIIKEKKELLRHILVSKKNIKDKKTEMAEKKREEKPAKKVELKEIDKKIEEILNE